MKARVIFVCLGNICRSPMAEAVFRSIVEQADLTSLIEIDSAGTGDWHLGHPPHEGTRKQLDSRGISCEGMQARQFTGDDSHSFDYIVCMDSKNEADVQAIIEASGVNNHGRVFKFMDLLPDKGITDVPDPYFTGDFDYVFDLVQEGCKKLLERVKADLSL